MNQDGTVHRLSNVTGSLGTQGVGGELVVRASTELGTIHREGEVTGAQVTLMLHQWDKVRPAVSFAASKCLVRALENGVEIAVPMSVTAAEVVLLRNGEQVAVEVKATCKKKREETVGGRKIAPFLGPGVTLNTSFHTTIGQN